MILPIAFSAEVWEYARLIAGTSLAQIGGLVRAALNELRDEYGFFVLDFHPSNIAFSREQA